MSQIEYEQGFEQKYDSTKEDRLKQEHAIGI